MIITGNDNLKEQSKNNKRMFAYSIENVHIYINKRIIQPRMLQLEHSWIDTLEAGDFVDNISCSWPSYPTIRNENTLLIRFSSNSEAFSIWTLCGWWCHQQVQIFNLRERVNSSDNNFTTGNTLLCGWRFEPAKDIIIHIAPRKHFFKIFWRITRKSWRNVFLVINAQWYA